MRTSHTWIRYVPVLSIIALPSSAFSQAIVASTITSSASPPAFSIDSSGNAILGSLTVKTVSGSVSRSLSVRFTEHLDVLDFGALCNGTTDDSAAFNATSAYALSNPKDNSAYEIDVPAGRCLLKSPWAINYNTNTSLRIHGDGSSHTELQFNGGINGLYVTFAANPNGNDFSRQGSSLGQGIEVDGIHFVSNTGSGDKGTALTVIGIPLVSASNPPFQVYSDLEFSNSGGYSDRANNWAGAMYLQDPDNVYVDHAMFWDHNLLFNVTSRDFWIHSTAPAAGPGHGNINLASVGAVGGNTGIQIDGNAIQGVNISHSYTIDVATGISWFANPNSLSGSLTIDHSSLNANRNIVEVGQVSTVFSDHNFYYNTGPTSGASFVAFQSEGGDTISSTGDTFVGPLAGNQGAGYASTAIFIASPGTYDPQGSIISGDIVSHFDNGYLASGGPTTFVGNYAGSDTGTCYRDTGTETDLRIRPTFIQMTCGQQLISTDSQALNSNTDWISQKSFNGSIELGLPGVVSSAGITGQTGQIDFHSTSANTIAALNDYDVRIRPEPGIPGTSGAAALDVYDTFTNFHTPIITNDLRYIGFTPPSTQKAACNVGDSGDGVLSGTYYHFFCIATNQWSRVALSTASW